MRKFFIIFIIIGVCFIEKAFAQFPTTTNLNALSISVNTREKPQSKLWKHDGKHWALLSNSSGAHVWRLDGNSWTQILNITSKTNRRADCKVDGNLVHIFLFRENSSDLVSIEYVPSNSTYKLWSGRTSAVRVSTDSDAETATIDIDSNGRMWLAFDTDTDIMVRWSDSPYSSWSSPISIASNIDDDDIGAVIAFPALNKIGVFWSNQNTERWGFKMHTDGTAPNSWSADEVPASQSALNTGQGMADDHMNLKVTSNGTLYCAIKTGYDRPGYPRIAMLIRRPSGSWDNLYGVSEIGTRGIIILNEQANKLRVIYTSDEHDGDILYKESDMSNIAFSQQYTLISGNYNNPTSIKNTYSSDVVILASTSSTAVSVLATDNGTLPPLPGVPTLNMPANNATGISLSPTPGWNASSNASWYQLQVSTSSGFATTVEDISNIASTSQNISGLNYSTQYFWRVRAYNAAGYSNWSAVQNFTTMAEPIIVPDVPVLALPANNSTNVDIQPTLSWNTSNNAVSYRLQASIASNFSSLVADSANITTLSSQLSGLNYSTKYYWRVKAYSSNGESNWSAVWNFTTETPPSAPPAIPTLASPANNSTGIDLDPMLSWNTANDALTYQVQLATASNFTTPIADISNLTETSASMTNLAFNTQYFWRVRAHNGVGASNWSAVWSFTTKQQPVALKGHWQMEDPAGTTLSDASGNGNHATTSSNPGFVSGKIGNALYLNGSNQYASANSSASLNPGSAITLAAWVKPESSDSRQTVLIKGVNSDGYELSITGSGKVTFRFNHDSEGKNYQLVSSDPIPTDGQTWTHIAVTFDGTTTNIYINGILEKSKSYSSAPAIGINNEPLSIGAADGSSRFQGALDDVRIYNIALSAADISNLATVSAARMATVSQNQAPVRPKLTAFPNPFRNKSTIRFKVPASGEYKVTLYNIAGKPVKLLKQGNADAGENLSVDLHGSELIDGLYLLRLQTSKTSHTLKLMHKF